MQLRDLAETCDRLEATRSRRTLVDIIADLLRRASAEDREPIVYLLQAALRPPYEGVELGVGDKLLVDGIAASYNANTTAVERRYRRLGDLGLVAAALAPKGRPRGRTVRDAYQALLAIARTSGAGSAERKRTLLVQLLRPLGAVGAKFIVRVAQGRLRLGVGDQTILEAAALAALGDRRQKALLEHAYNVRSDLGGVVRLAFARGGGAKLKALGPEIGIPVRPALAQRLGSAEAIIARLGEVQVEPKYDGFRVQIHWNGRRVWAFSRRLENVTDMFPELAQAARRQLKMSRAILEGEAVGYDPETGEFLSFQVTMTRKRKTRVAELAARHPLRLFAFDLLYAGRRNCLGLPQRERSARLRKLLVSRANDAIVVTDTLMTHDVEELERYFDEMIHLGLEGVLAKRPDAPYQPGARSYDWVKLKRAYQSKLRDTVDVVLVGYFRGRGRRAALGVGSLLAAIRDPTGERFRTVAKIGSGLSDSAWRDLRAELDKQASRTRPTRVDSLITPDVWVQPRVVVEVLADEITRSPFHTCGKTGEEPGYALRFPRMLGLRTDKSLADATTEREIIDLYRLQRGGRSPAPTRRKKAHRSTA